MLTGKKKKKKQPTYLLATNPLQGLCAQMQSCAITSQTSLAWELVQPQ